MVNFYLSSGKRDDFCIFFRVSKDKEWCVTGRCRLWTVQSGDEDKVDERG